MTDYLDVDAQELWNIINLYANKGYAFAERRPAPSEGRNDDAHFDTFSLVDNKGDYITGWHPDPQVIDALVKEGILEPEQWDETRGRKSIERKYRLTLEGERLAACNEYEVLSYFAEKGIEEVNPNDIWP